MSLYIPQMSDTPAITIPGLASNFQALDGSQIVEWGSNENGWYWRWENGLQICMWARPIYSGGVHDFVWDFPALFVSTWIVLASTGPTSRSTEIKQNWVMVGMNTIALPYRPNSVNVYVEREPERNIRVSLLAIGRWK